VRCRALAPLIGRLASLPASPARSDRRDEPRVWRCAPRSV